MGRFKRGHAKIGGRRKGTPNKSTGDIRAVAREILEDPAYLRSLRLRIIRGQAPRIEAMLFVYLYGDPVRQPTLDPETPVRVIMHIPEPALTRKRTPTLSLPTTDHEDSESPGQSSIEHHS